MYNGIYGYIYIYGSLWIIVPRNLHGFYGSAIGGISRVCLSFLSKASILLLFLQHLILFWSLLTSSRPAALRSSVLSTRAVGPKPQPHSSSEQSLLQAFWLDLDGFGPFGSWSKWTKGRCHSKKLSHATSADLIEDTYSYFVPIHSNFRYLHLERVKCMGNSDPQIFKHLLSQQFAFQAQSAGAAYLDWCLATRSELWIALQEGWLDEADVNSHI